MHQREIKIAEFISVYSEDYCGKKFIIISGDTEERGIVEISKDEAFKLAYALISLASEL
jgi:hypothetical protein